MRQAPSTPQPRIWVASEWRGWGIWGSTTSVNDLITHLRRTQTPNAATADDTPTPRRLPSVPIPHSIHPSLRSILEFPEVQPPQPRPGAHRTAIGARPSRRTAGPPPPQSWLAASTEEVQPDNYLVERSEHMETIIYRLKRLPGATFPGPMSLTHLVLKTMALNWARHVQYDGLFLAELPNNMKELLLSYLAVFTNTKGRLLNGYMTGFKPLFLPQQDQDHTTGGEYVLNEAEYLGKDASVIRLDLGGAIGNWISFKQLTNELIISKSSAAGVSGREREEEVPASWDEKVQPSHARDATLAANAFQPSSIPKEVTPKLRFENLRFLSLAHPTPSGASWTALLSLLARLTKITHLSLAHWPTPTRIPGSRVPSIGHSLYQSYSGADNLLQPECDWAEAASILRQLSRATYCLKWLDLEGCADWLRALNWVGEDPNGVPYPPGAVGPDWNGSWRDVDWVGLGPGWIPILKDNDGNYDPAAPSSSDDEESDVRRLNKLQVYRGQFHTGLAVRQRLRQIRHEVNGKWIEVSLGLDDVAPQIIRQLVGQAYALHS
ncbi:uncharacterized protein N7529_010545 [Penicillium soppii]|uniref:uncharacterized protein n=1 Tax=Penicillium soppii TaxID=69789 RepID=UPI002549919B|nr:uncharacterized protein N7529_010545 [Penicillium soppii]KAJ5856601.1 hypothetical protein N7529_010545 [Penicillium soppii]